MDDKPLKGAITESHISEVPPLPSEIILRLEPGATQWIAVNPRCGYETVAEAIKRYKLLRNSLHVVKLQPLPGDENGYSAAWGGVIDTLEAGGIDWTAPGKGKSMTGTECVNTTLKELIRKAKAWDEIVANGGGDD